MHIAKDRKSAKVWLQSLEADYAHGYNERELKALLAIVAETGMTGSDRGMSPSDFETEEMRPIAASCDDDFVYVTLADGRQIRAPLWWYPFLAKASATDRAAVELMYGGVWWPAMDEGVSVKGMLLGWKAPGASKPRRAA